MSSQVVLNLIRRGDAFYCANSKCNSGGEKLFDSIISAGIMIGNMACVLTLVGLRKNEVINIIICIYRYLKFNLTVTGVFDCYRNNRYPV